MNRRSFLTALAAGPALLTALTPPERFNRCPSCGRRYDIDSTAFDLEVRECSDCFEKHRPSRIKFRRSRKVFNGEIYWSPEVEADMMAMMRLRGEG